VKVRGLDMGGGRFLKMGGLVKMGGLSLSRGVFCFRGFFSRRLRNVSLGNRWCGRVLRWFVFGWKIKKIKKAVTFCVYAHLN
jgi:hypothetical protein